MGLTQKNVAIVTGVIVLAFAAGYFYLRQREIAHDLFGKGLKAWSFEAKDRAQNTVKFSDFKGRVILLHFWASWCEPCIDEIPELIEFSKSLDPKKSIVVMVSLDKSWEEAEKVSLMTQLPPAIISLIDTSATVAKLYGSFQYPETFLINKDLGIVTKWIGPQKWGSSFFLDAIKHIENL